MPLYTLWTDTMFYVYAGAFCAALVSLIYSIRGYLELANAAPYADNIADDQQLFAKPAAAEAETEELPFKEPEPQTEPPEKEARPQEPPAGQDAEKTLVVANIEELISQSMEDAPEMKTGEFPADDAPREAFPDTAPVEPQQQEAPAAEPMELPQEEVPAAEPEELPLEEAPAADPVELPVQEKAELPVQASKAEEFVKGIYNHISRIDSRLDAMESSISKTNGDFALKFLEDMMTDYDALNKEKIRARIEFLISDLKK